VGKYYKLMDDWLIEYLVILYRMYNEDIDGMLALKSECWLFIINHFNFTVTLCYQLLYFLAFTGVSWATLKE
jgi:hypothetical protein